MNILESMILGFVQGLTEFLPISSSGHLVLLESVFKLSNPGENLLFNLVLHLGTMLATVIVFRQQIYDIFKSIINIKKIGIRNIKYDNNLYLTLLIIIACIPTAIIGFIVDKYFESFAINLIIVSLMFVISAIILILTIIERKKQKEEFTELQIKDAIIVGIVQGLAVMPGLSRSGSTISASLFLGFSRETAGVFSFLISLPAIFGANMLKLIGGDFNANIDIIPLLIGFITAFGSGYVFLKLLLKIIKKGKLYFFAFYCFIIAIITLIIGLN